MIKKDNIIPQSTLSYLKKDNIKIKLDKNRTSKCKTLLFQYDLENKTMTEIFKTTQDIWEYLISGGMIIGDYSNTPIIKLENGNLKEITGKIAYYAFELPEKWKPYIKKEWYENITKPILCKCDLLFEQITGKYLRYDETIVIIKGYDKEYERFIDMENNQWKYAKPITLEEVSKYIL